MKLFWLGVAIQGGGWPAQYVYGYNLWNMRWCGILQRIAWGYFVVALAEIWLPTYDMSGYMPEEVVHVPADPAEYTRMEEAPATTHIMPWEHLRNIIQEQACIIGTHSLKWLVAIAFMALYLALLYQTWVPTWTIEYGIHKGKSIECDVRGELTPSCAATGYYDRMLLGQKVTQTWMSVRSEACSSCSPASLIFSTGVSCLNATATPTWCSAPLYDPEGLLASVNAVMSVWLGLYFGLILKHPHGNFAGNHSKRLAHWLLCSVVLIVVGEVIEAAGMPMNKQLWTSSYVFYMAGAILTSF